MPKLEDLELRIKQTGDLKASTPKKLAESLERLSAAVKGFPKSAENISELNSAIKSIDAAKATALSKAATAIGRLAEQTEKVDANSAGNIAAIGAAIEQMIDGINVEKLNSIGDALGKFRTAVSGLRGASPSVRAAKATKASSPKSAEDTEAVRSSTTAALEAFAEVEDKTNWVALEKQYKLLEMLKGIGVETENATDRFKDMRQVLEETSVDDVMMAIYKLNEAVNEGDYDKISKALREAESAFAHFPSATEEAADNGMRLRDVFKDLAKATLPHVASGIKKIGKAAIEGGKNLLSMGWDKLKSKVTGLIGPLQNLVHSFARIAMYRGLRTAIKAITSGFSEGIKHLYEWSAIVGNNFKQSMDSLATSAHYLRDSLGAMASPLIDALAPAVEFLVDKFVNLLNIVNQFIATFTGASSWRRAVRTPTEYSSGMEDAAKSTKKATEAQKKLNKALMDFDEIHLITTSTSGGSNPSSPSGGGGASGIDSTHFVEEPIADWIQAIKDAIDNGDWYGAGKMLADKLNGIIDQWDAKSWGEKLGEKVENGLKFYLGFMKNFRWDTLGIKASDFINGMLSKIDPKDLGDAITAKFEAALQFLANFVPNLKLTGLGTALGVAFNNIFSKETMNNLADTIAGAVNDVTDFAKGFLTEADFKGAARNVMGGLFRAITTIDWQTMGENLADFGTGLLDALFEALDYAITHLDEIVGAIVLFVNGFFGKLGDYFHEKLFGWADDVNKWFAEVFGTEGAIGSAVPDSLVGDFDVPKLNVDDSDVTEANDNAITLQKTLALLNKKKYSAKVTVTGVSTAATNADKLKNALTKINGQTFAATVKVTTKGVTTATNANGKYVSLAYAQGGYPDMGSIFVAGEAGPEFVSNINGKTAVASGKEVTGIADAVYSTGDAEAKLLREQNNLLRLLLAKKTDVTLAPNAAAGKWVAQSQMAYAKASG